MSEATIETFEAREPDGDEIGTLRARIAALEAEIAHLKEQARAQSEREQLLSGVIEHAPSIIFVKSATDWRYLLVNRACVESYGNAPEQVLGKRDEDLLPPEGVAALRAADEAALRAGKLVQLEEAVPDESGVRHFSTVKFPIRGLSGEIVGICGIATDITEQKRREAEQLALKEQIIAAQDEALRELSSPIVPIADGVLAMPLVGAIDERRAEQIMQTLLEGIGAQMTHTVILDITGVRTLDATAASALVSSARAAGLLGARVVLTGIQPHVARTLIELGVDLGGITTRSTLQSGIAFALSARR
jgi:anti-anti-sigma factor